MQLHNAPSPIWWAVQAGIALNQSNEWIAKARQNKADQLSYSSCLQMAWIARKEYRRMIAYALKIHYRETGSVAAESPVVKPTPLTLVHSSL